MDRTELVHMIALVGAAAGVEEGKQPGNKQRGFVMRHGVGTGKYRAGLAVETAAVSKEYLVFRGILLG